MEALVHHQRAAPCGHETVIVVADRPDIEGSARAERLGIPNVIEPVAGSTRAAHERRVEQHLIDANVDLIVCSGWMRLLTPAFVDRWAPRILNIHPSLLPEFPGLMPIGMCSPQASRSPVAPSTSSMQGWIQAPSSLKSRSQWSLATMWPASRSSREGGGAPPLPRGPRSHR